jgi:hypothetical protein
MKKHRISWIGFVILFVVIALGVPASMAAPEGEKALPQAPSEKSQGPVSGPTKITGPVDSAKVIPKGPQWLGAPIMPGVSIPEPEGTRLHLEYNLPYTQVLTWYQEALKNYPDARYRDWKEEMYIEDQGGSKWHAIIISKTGGPKTPVTIVKDNWTWIMATLFIRFTGVFVVLLILWMGLNFSGAIMQRFFKEEESPKKKA